MSEVFERYARPIISGLEPLPLDDAKIIHREELPTDDWDAGIFDALRDLGGELFDADTDLFAELSSTEQLHPITVEVGADEILPEEIEAIQNGIWRYGFEVLGFYKSYRYVDRKPFPGRWGIFVPRSAISFIADDIMGWYLGQFSQEEAATKALKMIHAHERFHFRFDAWALHLEEAAGKALYEAYKKCVYQNLYPHPLVVEESLANNHAYRSMRGEGISEFLRYFMDSQPGAYREYQERTDKYHEGAEINRGRLCAQLLNPLDVICAVAQEGAIQEGWMRRLSSPKGGAAISQDEMCPTYIISGARISDILPPSALGAPSLKEIKRFVKGYLGGKLLERTDHDYYRIDNGAKMKMPNPHANTDCCKPQEFNNIRMKAGMLTADYKSERSKTRVWRRSVPRLAPKQPIV